jgi:hypothetical protein
LARYDGLTEEEGVVMDNLVAAANAFFKLEPQHPSEMREFQQGIHQCTSLLAVRVCRDVFPQGWPKR